MRYFLAAAIVAALLAVGCSGDGGSGGGSGGPPDLTSDGGRSDVEDFILDSFQAVIERDEDAFREVYSEECRDDVTIAWDAMWAGLGIDEDSELGISDLEVVEEDGSNATVLYVYTIDGGPLTESDEVPLVWEEGAWRSAEC